MLFFELLGETILFTHTIINIKKYNIITHQSRVVYIIIMIFAPYTYTIEINNFVRLYYIYT